MSRVAYVILAVAGIAHCSLAIVGLYFIDWIGISSSLSLNFGIVVVGGALAWFVNLGLFGALPLSAAHELARSPRRSLVLCGIATISAAFWTPATAWLGFAHFIVLGTAFALVVIANTRATVSRTNRPGPLTKTKYASAAWVLLVGGGLIGAHNFYLRRAWAAVMSVGLLLVTTLTWSSLLFLVLVGILGTLLIRDGFKIGVRIQEMNRSVAVPEIQRRFRADAAPLKGARV